MNVHMINVFSGKTVLPICIRQPVIIFGISAERKNVGYRI